MMAEPNGMMVMGHGFGRGRSSRDLGASDPFEELLNSEESGSAWASLIENSAVA